MPKLPESAGIAMLGSSVISEVSVLTCIELLRLHLAAPFSIASNRAYLCPVPSLRLALYPLLELFADQSYTSSWPGPVV